VKLLAFDTETYLIAPRESVPQGAVQINVSPYVTPKLILGSVMYDGQSGATVLSPVELRDALMTALIDPDTHLVAQHFPFDHDVVCTAFPELVEPFRSALDAGRCHDTKILDVLYRLSTGYFDTPDPNANWALPEVKPRSLDALALEYLNVQVPKDLVDDDGDLVRLSFHKWDGGDIKYIPRIFLDYAAKDAHITLRLFQHLAALAPADLWGEPAQVRAEVAFYALDKIGVRIDQAEAQRLQHLFSRDMPAYQRELVEEGLGEWMPVTGTVKKERFEGDCVACDDPPLISGRWHVSHVTGSRVNIYRWRVFKHHFFRDTALGHFHLFQAVIRAKLEDFALANGIDFKTTDGGDLSIQADEWKDRIPKDRPELQTWLAHERLKKILTTYLNLYARVTQVFPKWYSLRARTTRTSTASPNVQNVSKNKHGIRSLFVPHDGYVFMKADYSFQELVTLAQEMLELGIKGPLYDAIQIGDPHTSTAALLLNCDPVKIGKKSPERQAAKALNFGVPGGLGAAKLRDYAAKDPYRVNWTLEQAKEMRQSFLAVYPDIEEYLERHKTSLSANLLRVTGRNAQYWCEKLGVRSFGDLRKAMVTSKDPAIRGLFYKAERSLEVRLGTGFVRKGCAFTEGANTRFQGRAASVSKEAMWRVFSCPELRSLGARAVMMIHDEIVLETPLTNAARASELLVEHMLAAFRDVCPDTGPFAKVEVEGPLVRWGKATDSAGLTI